MIVHRCAYIVYQSGDMISHCGQSAGLYSPGVPLCGAHRTSLNEDSNVVYFIAWGEYVKIGTTSLSATSRMRQIVKGGTVLPPDVYGVPVVLATVPGDRLTESAFHAILAPYRAEGEWFRRVGPVEDFVDWVTEKHGLQVLMNDEVDDDDVQQPEMVEPAYGATGTVEF